MGLFRGLFSLCLAPKNHNFGWNAGCQSIQLAVDHLHPKRRSFMRCSPKISSTSFQRLDQLWMTIQRAPRNGHYERKWVPIMRFPKIDAHPPRNYLMWLFEPWMNMLMKWKSLEEKTGSTQQIPTLVAGVMTGLSFPSSLFYSELPILRHTTVLYVAMWYEA